MFLFCPFLCASLTTFLHTQSQIFVFAFLINFLEAEDFANSPLESFLKKLAFVMRNLLAGLVHRSIEDWVDFIRCYDSDRSGMGSLGHSELGRFTVVWLDFCTHPQLFTFKLSSQDGKVCHTAAVDASLLVLYFDV